MKKDIATLKPMPHFSKRATFLQHKFRGSTFWTHLPFLFPYYFCSFWVALACFGLFQFITGCSGSLLDHYWQTTSLKLFKVFVRVSIKERDNIVSISDKILFGFNNSVHFKTIVRGGNRTPATSNIELIVTTLNCMQLLTIVTKNSI